MKLLVTRLLALVIMAAGVATAYAQSPKVERVDPPHWWVGFSNPNVQLLIKGENLSAEVELVADAVKLINAELAPNNNYLLVDLEIAPFAKHQTIQLIIKNGNKKKTLNYQLHKRETANKTLMGLNQADLMYLITPDRFANGNPKNDVIKDMNEATVDRADDYKRHGGDIAGIMNHLDYLDDLGVTALWINPLVENDQPEQSYHGYAITDHYKIDARFGTNEDYRKLVDAMHNRGMKMIMDVVYNHWGNEHYLYKDLPDSAMIHWFDDFTRTNYRATALHDPYASLRDKMLMNDGWFDHHMPDLDQTNPILANYLIQNSIWWIEEFGIDAYRIDTYAYPDQAFMSELSKRIHKEYPNFFIFGETWVHGVQVQNYFIEANRNRLPFSSNLQSVTDFQWYFALEKGINEKTEWTNGMSRLYYVLSGDYMYDHPEDLIIFVDNHDIARWYGVCKEDMDKFNIGIALLLTSRGIPQLYYGTEILMKATDGHGPIREDFWGGWPEDTVNKFMAAGRTELENEAFNYIRKLATFRKNSNAITKGTLTQFTPLDGVYSYIRHSKDGDKVLVMINGSDDEATIDMSRYAELIPIGYNYTDIVTDETGTIPATVKLAGRKLVIWELR